jgi:glycosyltransferase A (GT-A) superfamily protein (DUF2064 family)
LIGRLSPDQAAELHSAFLGDVTERLAEGDFDLRVAWALDSGAVPPDLGLKSMAQAGDDLGDRLFGVLRRLSETYSYVGAIGSDHPDLPLSLVHEAFDKLSAGVDVVLGPAHDGGYYLIAMRGKAIHRDLFSGVEWSSGSVLSSTLARCRSLGLGVAHLQGGYDVDTSEDLDRLAATLAADLSIRCPRTRDLLGRWGLGSGSERRIR